jgi:uroporphyrin-III C-methyltransferase
MESQAGFPKPTQGASLILSFRLHSRTVVIVGSGRLAASRAFLCLESDAHVVLLGRGGLESACDEIKWRVKHSQIEWRAIEEQAKLWRAGSPVGSSEDIDEPDEDEAALHSVLSRLPSVSFVCITDTLIASRINMNLAPRSKASASRLYDIACHTYRIPTNTTDMPSLCDFSFPATHRFRSAENNGTTALQVETLLWKPLHLTPED